MAQVIENVRQSEELFRNLELETITTYALHQTDGSDTKGLLESATRQVRVVLQGNLIYVNATGLLRPVAGESREVQAINGFDGELTRQLEGEIGNIHHGRKEDCRIYLYGTPHNWLLKRAHACFPLSLWLRGGAEVQNHPAAGLYKDWQNKVVFDGEEVVDGLHCVKVRSEAVSSRGTKTVRFLWLATERHYLPVKTVFLNNKLNPELPVEIGNAKDFREIAPGIWLPFLRSIVVYDESQLYQRKSVVGNSEETKIVKAKLDPQYDIALFRNISFSNATAVYEIKNDQIIGGGLRERSSPSAIFGPWTRVWMVLIAAILLLLSGRFALRWLRSRREVTIVRAD